MHFYVLKHTLSLSRICSLEKIQYNCQLQLNIGTQGAQEAWQVLTVCLWDMLHNAATYTCVYTTIVPHYYI